MRIAKIHIKEEATNAKNLKEINIKVGSTVALVGKNGAGKSRILKFVEQYLNNISYEEFFDNHFQEIPETLFSITNNLNELYTNHLSEQSSGLPSKLRSVFNDEIKKFKELGSVYIKVVDTNDLNEIKPKLTTNGNLTFEQILDNSHFESILKNPNQLNNPQLRQNILLNEFSILNSEQTLNYLKKITGQIVIDEFNLYTENRENPEKVQNIIKEKVSYQIFNKLQFYIKQFLGKDFTYKQSINGSTLNSVLHFNNQPFSLNLFSPGQKTLFAYAILFFYLDINSNANIKESIIIIDEPERHLHPEAQIALIDALKSIIADKGQLWIATHSVHILSHLEFDEIFLVQDDEIIPPSRTTPMRSLRDLMGIDNHIQELSTFVNSISEWSYANFMLQCFKEPDVIFSKSTNDPQFLLFKQFVSKKETLDILDFGAGKGRIGFTLMEDLDLSSKINYSAYEINQEHHSSIIKIPKITGLFSNIDEIKSSNILFDCILLCNVFHEIAPTNWLETLINIKDILKDNGSLIFIEDKILPKGENANEFGYLILGTEEVKKLINSKDIIEYKLENINYKERILFNIIRKDQINPTKESIVKAIKLLEDNSFSNIKQLRLNNSKDVSQGRIYANATQLYINAKLALEVLAKT